jgi:hypothetical protein
LDKIHPHARSRRPYGQANRPCGLTDSLSVINVNKTEAFILNES